MQVAEAVWELAQQADVALQNIRPAKNSLEEIFIDTVKEAENATT